MKLKQSRQKSNIVIQRETRDTEQESGGTVVKCASLFTSEEQRETRASGGFVSARHSDKHEI